MSRFHVSITPLSGLVLVQRAIIEDHRGFLSRFFCAADFLSFGVTKPIVQMNHTHTKQRGTVRGLHFQHHPFAEAKLVSCLRGEIWDVAVDLRADSPTFLHWHAEALSGVNRRSLLIPEGFAHGFQTLTDDCELIYLHTAPYTPAAAGALNVLDSAIGIKWPLSIIDISEADAKRPFIDNYFGGI